MARFFRMDSLSGRFRILVILLIVLVMDILIGRLVL